MSTPGKILNSIWDSIKLGEIVLMERLDTGDQYFGFYQLMEWGLEEGYTLLVIDILDSLHIVKSKLKLSGFDKTPIEDVDVIKIGGKIPTGNVIGWVEDLSEPIILAQKFREIYDDALNRNPPALSIVLGLEKLFLASDFSPKSIQLIIYSISQYLGDERRLAVQFFKVPLIDPGKSSIINLLEDIATTVIRVKKENKITEFHVAKSINREIYGTTIRV